MNKKGNLCTDSTQYLLKVGERAWALHPICKHIHEGQIYSQYQPEIYFIKFKDPRLGTFRIQEY